MEILEAEWRRFSDLTGPKLVHIVQHMSVSGQLYNHNTDTTMNTSSHFTKCTIHKDDAYHHLKRGGKRMLHPRTFFSTRKDDTLPM